jgi:serine/threonine protein kinase
MTLARLLAEARLVRNLPCAIHGYTFTKYIGCGGYGEVYKVVNDRYQTAFVAKVILVSGSGEDARQKWGSFNNEIVTLSMLDNPHIIRIYDHFQEGNLFILILEFCHGGDLETEIGLSRTGLAPDRFREVAAQIVDALRFCHSHGIAHRDVKPSNILFDHYGRVKLADFGLAVPAVGIIKKQFGGSIYYDAPEILSMTPYEPLAVDVWSLGVTFLTMLRGVHPWSGDNFAQLKARIISGEYEVDGRVPEQVRSLIAKMVVVNPADRLKIEDVAADPLFRTESPIPHAASEETMKRFRSRIARSATIPLVMGAGAVIRRSTMTSRKP